LTIRALLETEFDAIGCRGGAGFGEQIAKGLGVLLTRRTGSFEEAESASRFTVRRNAGVLE
jgi:hypothetical protein